MSPRIERFNAIVPWPLRLVLVIGAGFLLLQTVEAALPTLWAASAKVRGLAPNCPWPQVFSLQRDLLRFSDQRDTIEPLLRADVHDDVHGIERIIHPDRAFWIRRAGQNWDGRNLLAYLIAEHEWMALQNPEAMVKHGDIVIDCGAHIGVFTHQALQSGAAKVVAIDPDPTQVECLRRNFAGEIASGRVIVVPKGVWSKEGSMTLHVGEQNSGESSLVFEIGRDKVEVPVTTIDQIAAELDLPRIDYIKLDIEGAEREALRGAAETLRRYKPRILLESYHREDDLDVLPTIIQGLRPDYFSTCGPCEFRTEPQTLLVPHYLFFQ